jgi:hypothetical protein
MMDEHYWNGVPGLCEHPDNRRDQTPLGEVFCLDCGELLANDEDEFDDGALIP